MRGGHTRIGKGCTGGSALIQNLFKSLCKVDTHDGPNDHKGTFVMMDTGPNTNGTGERYNPFGGSIQLVNEVWDLVVVVAARL